MKKLSTNENDKYLINELKHEKRLEKSKKLTMLVKEDARDFCSIGLLCGCLIFSAKSIKEIGGMLVDTYDSIKYSLESTTQEDNDKELEEIYNNGYVSILNLPTSYESKYYFQNRYLYNENNEIMTLENYEDPVYFYYCILDYQTLENIRLRDSKTKELCLTYSCLDDRCIECLPESVEELSLSYCFYLRDLHNLPRQCPNIKVLHINSLVSVKDFSFLFEFENLEEVNVADSAYITEDIINGLNERGIKHNLSETDLENNRTTDDIISEIIKPNMSDKEKISSIVEYVLNHIEYDISQARDSNANPLNCVFDDGKAVCISYAYLTQVLLDKAHVKSYLVTSDSHAWNMVNIDGKYYYVDTTGMDSLEFNNLLFDVFNIGLCYMGDTENVTFSSMEKIESELVNIPQELLEDVLISRDEKGIIEKYGQTVDAAIIWLSYFLKGFLMINTSGIIVNIKRKSKKILRDYQNYDKVINHL